MRTPGAIPPLAPDWWQSLREARNVRVILLLLLSPTITCAQVSPAGKPAPTTEGQPQAAQATQPGCSGASSSSETVATSGPVPCHNNRNKSESKGQQTKRMFWIVPNFAAVSANTELPRLSTSGKFALAVQDSFDYSSFVWTGVLAAQSWSVNAYPELGGGAAAYGRYYWRGFADGVSGTFFTEAIVPSLTRQDPRYYTRGHGGFLRRTGYALSRVVLTKTDSGGTAFNFSEVLGNGMEAGLSNLYYPPQERGVSNTAVNWATQMESAALNNIAKEFWPDIRRKILRQN